MKEDYLWNKTGENADIEKLEIALKAFRYQESAPPALPAKIVPFEKKSSRRFFRLSFAFAAFAAALIICFGVWFQFSADKIETATELPEIIAPNFEENYAKEIPAQKPTVTVNQRVKMPKQFIEQKAVKIETQKQSIKGKIVEIKNIPAVENQKQFSARSLDAEKLNNPVVQNIEIKKPPVKLTKEEKYAYDQLMLALSITSSKLKLVTDKIENVEEENAVRENER